MGDGEVLRMTAKRFEICDVDLYEYGMPLNEIMDNGVPLSQNQVCELLNELHEENTMLKERRHEDINELSVIAMKYKALENENEQLKQQLTELNIPINEVKEVVVDYKRRVERVYYND